MNADRKGIEWEVGYQLEITAATEFLNCCNAQMDLEDKIERRRTSVKQLRASPMKAKQLRWCREFEKEIAALEKAWNYNEERKIEIWANARKP